MSGINGILLSPRRERRISWNRRLTKDQLRGARPVRCKIEIITED